MTETVDPLVAYLLGELEQIEAAAGLRRRLPFPVVPLESSAAVARTFSWSFRYTWQEVERGRRYVLPLDRERARLAQRAALAAIRAMVDDTIGRLIAEGQLQLQATAQPADGASLSWTTADGVNVEFLNDAAVLALPLSAVQRRVQFRAGLNAYSVSESVQVGVLQVMRPDLLRAWRSASGSPEIC